MDKWISKITELLDNNNIEYDISNNYINIHNTSSSTRVKIFEYECGTIGTCVAIEVQEFDEFGNQTYSKEFATLGKSFLNRINRNRG